MSTPTRLLVPAFVLGLAAFDSIGAHAQGVPARGPERVTDIAEAITGQIEGTVADDVGQPLDGVVISALGATAAFAVSDKTGQFSLRQLSPGPYLLRAHLQGFLAARGTMVTVRPAVRTPSSFTLRREGTRAAPRVVEAGLGATAIGAPAPAGNDADGRDESEVAWRLRHLKRSVLRDADTMAVVPVDNDNWFLPDSFGFLGRAVGTSARAASAFFSDLSLDGQVNLLTTGAFDTPLQLLQRDRATSVAFFSLGAPVGSRATWAVRAAMSQSDLSSWILAGSYVVHAPAAHRYQMGMSYGLQRHNGGNAVALATAPEDQRTVGSMFAFDEWTVSPRLTVGYGASVAHYDYLEGPALFSPRLTATLAPTPRTRIHASATRQLSAPGAEEFVPPARAEYLPPQRTFSTLGPGGFRTEELQHYEVGVERLLRGATIGVRAFRQRIDDQTVTVFGSRLAGDTVAASLGHYYVGSAGDANVNGLGVTLTHALVDNVRGSIDYSLSSAKWTDGPPAIEYAVLTAWVPAAVRPPQERIHDVSTSLQAEVPLSATRVVVFYKVSNAFVREGAGDRTGLDARFDLQVNQALPFMNFSTSQWEMLVAVRNLFHDSLTNTSAYDELLVIRPPKRIVGGLTVRF